MPLPGSVSIRMPVMALLSANLRACWMEVPVGRHRGWAMTALWLRLIWATLRACLSMVMARWTTPRPPSMAMALAMSAPVTLSMLAETMGSSNAMPWVKGLDKLMSRRDPAKPFCGRNRKSS